MALETVPIIRRQNIQYPPAKLLRRSFGALAKAEVLYGGQVEQGMHNDEVFTSLRLLFDSAKCLEKFNSKQTKSMMII